MKKPLLQSLLAYNNPTVVHYFSNRYPSYNHHASQVLFKDLLGWLWLNALRQERQQPTWFFGPLLPMDEMWHCFILHTRDYHAFCQHYFGDYFHHDIEPAGAEYQLNPEEIASFLEDCFEHLGDEWVNRNFHEALADEPTIED